MQRETLVGIAWAVGLILAMGAVFAYEVATFELDTYDVSWGTESESLSASGNLDQGGSDTHTFSVDGADLAAIVVRLDWADNGDTFRVQVAGPDGTGWEGNVESNGGALELRVPAGQAREGGEVGAVDEDQAISQFEATSPYEGEKDWTVTVTLVSAPGQEVAGVEIQADGSEAYDLTFEQQYYVASATLVE